MGCAESSAPLERRAHTSDGLREIFHDELRRQPHHPPPAAPECTIAARVRRAPRCVIRAINFDDDARRGHGEVRDVLCR